MNFDDLTIAEVRHLAAMAHQFLGGPVVPALSSAYKVGESRMFRTVTHIITGRIVSIHSDGIVVTDAAWVADTGRYSGAVATATFSEVEPYPDGALVVVNASAMIDSVEIKTLPRVQK